MRQAIPRQFSSLWSLHQRIGLAALIIILLFTCFAPRFESESVRWAGHFFSHTFHNVYLVLGILALLFVIYQNKSKALFTQFLAAIGAETAIVQISQKGFYYGLGWMARPSGKDGGFPSGHTAAHCVIAYLLTERFPRLGPLWYTLAGLVSWSRWQDGAHYPYQVVAGAVVGLTCAALLAPHFGQKEHEPVTAAPSS